MFWNIQRDTPEPFFSNPNYAPKQLPVENCFLGRLGRGNWTSTIEGVLEGLQWTRTPWEVAPPDYKELSGESRLALADRVLSGADVRCMSSSDLSCYSDLTFDLVITDPPFGDNIFYSDLANFFHAWLRLPLKKEFPELFDPVKTPEAQEALAPRLLPEEEANEYYRVRLTACWSEAHRVLKDGGLLAFTFHHSEDAQWAVVLQSLFESGFILEQTYPIASDEMKGQGGQFGAKGTEYDIIHVCRKRLVDPKAVSWPKMRQWVKAELNRLRRLLESYKLRELSEADVRVILRGKALEFYSRHFGQVFTAENETLPIRDALLGINQLLDEDTGQPGDRPLASFSRWPTSSCVCSAATGRCLVTRSARASAGPASSSENWSNAAGSKKQGKIVCRVPIRERFEAARKRPRKEMKTRDRPGPLPDRCGYAWQRRQLGRRAYPRHLDGPPKRGGGARLVRQDGSGA